MSEKTWNRKLGDDTIRTKRKPSYQEQKEAVELARRYKRGSELVFPTNDRVYAKRFA